MPGQHQVQHDLDNPKASFLAWSYWLIESATSAAVASAILLTNRTNLMASRSGP